MLLQRIIVERFDLFHVKKLDVSDTWRDSEATFMSNERKQKEDKTQLVDGVLLMEVRSDPLERRLCLYIYIYIYIYMHTTLVFSCIDISNDILCKDAPVNQGDMNSGST